jgi:alanyl-tRNA synthetase
VLKFDTSRLWVTVHEDDDEAERIWRDDEGFPADRIQRLGEANWWSMGDTGPCGPSSEIFWDLGPEYGPDGGPTTDHDRYIEIWNLVFMTYDQRADGTRVPLPKPSIDTGAGLERNLLVAQGHTSIWDIDVFRPLIARAEELTGVRYGDTEATDISLRIVAEHARAMTFVIADGVRPSNNERGYVLRRIIRRAVLHSYLLGARDLVLPAMIDVAVDVMGAAYPEIVAGRETVAKVVEREEKAFRATLQRGVEMLGELLDQGDVSGRDAFFLHDTLGFPIDLTREIAGVRDRGVDLDDFDRRMTQQRERARAAADEAGAAAGDSTVWREVLDEFGPTEFTGRREAISKAKVIALVVGGEPVDEAGEGMAVEVALDRTPFYAESGGQVGDTGTITTLSDPKANRTVLEVRDTRYGIAGSVVVHECTVRTGTIQVDDEVEAAIDEVRRDRIRRNHTATHILHWALREVLGAHVQQAGSMVAPDRLRFDFSHHDAVTPDQLAQVERLANLQVISDAPVRHYETTKAEAERIGAIAFFGEKYGEIVRVLEAGPSTELCGGTHVHALGFIGPIKIVSESSIGSNLRRIEAVTGDGAFEYIEQEEELLRRAGSLLRAAPKEVPEKIERLSEQVRTLQEELQKLKAKEAVSAAADLATEAHDGAVVQRHDGLSNEELRRLAQETVRALGSGVVALAGTGPDGVKAGIAVAVSKDLVERGVSADAIARPAAKALGGGVGKGADAVVGGGPNAAGIDEALQLVRDQAATWKT